MNRRETKKSTHSFRNMVNGRGSGSDDNVLKEISARHRQGSWPSFKSLYDAYNQHNPTESFAVSSSESSVITPLQSYHHPPTRPPERSYPVTSFPAIISEPAPKITYQEYVPLLLNRPYPPATPGTTASSPAGHHQSPQMHAMKKPWTIPRKSFAPPVIAPRLPPTPPAYAAAEKEEKHAGRLTTSTQEHAYYERQGIDPQSTQTTDSEYYCESSQQSRESTTQDDGPTNDNEDESTTAQHQEMRSSPSNSPEQVVFVNGRYYPAFSFPSLLHSTLVYIIHSLDSCFLPSSEDIMDEENVFSIIINDVTALQYFPQLLWNIIYTEEIRLEKYYIPPGEDEINLLLKLRSADEVKYIKELMIDSCAHYDIIPVNIPNLECEMCFGFDAQEIEDLGISISRPKTAATNIPIITESINLSTTNTRQSMEGRSSSDQFSDIFASTTPSASTPFKYSDAVNTDMVDSSSQPHQEEQRLRRISRLSMSIDSSSATLPVNAPQEKTKKQSTYRSDRKPVGIPLSTTPSYAAAARSTIHRNSVVAPNPTAHGSNVTQNSSTRSKKAVRYRFSRFSSSSSPEEEGDAKNKTDAGSDENTNTSSPAPTQGPMLKSAVMVPNFLLTRLNMQQQQLQKPEEENIASLTEERLCAMSIEEDIACDKNIDVRDSEMDRLFNLSIFDPPKGTTDDIREL